MGGLLGGGGGKGYVGPPLKLLGGGLPPPPGPPSSYAYVFEIFSGTDPEILAVASPSSFGFSMNNSATVPVLVVMHLIDSCR